MYFYNMAAVYIRKGLKMLGSFLIDIKMRFFFSLSCSLKISQMCGFTNSFNYGKGTRRDRNATGLGASLQCQAGCIPASGPAGARSSPTDGQPLSRSITIHGISLSRDRAGRHPCRGARARTARRTTPTQRALASEQLWGLGLCCTVWAGL